jgi:hypothetical protein
MIERRAQIPELSRRASADAAARLAPELSPPNCDPTWVEIPIRTVRFRSLQGGQNVIKRRQKLYARELVDSPETEWHNQNEWQESAIQSHSGPGCESVGLDARQKGFGLRVKFP